MKMPSNTPPAKDPRDLFKHFSDTYFSLRMGLAGLAFAMPFVLYLYGKLRHGLDLQTSMSAYFWAASAEQCATFPMRTIFVGFLLAIGVGLYLYKGLTSLENWLLNVAAICAGLVAIYPERLTVKEALTDQRLTSLYEHCPAVKAWAELPSWPVHYVAAVTLFVLLAIVAWRCAENSLEYIASRRKRTYYRRIYKAIAIAMILFPVVGIAVAYLFGAGGYKVFLIEAAGILTFGTYWAVKSRELSLSGLERDPVEAVEHAKQGDAVEGQAV